MSNSQQQSLDDNVIFLPVNESSAEFLHCEMERSTLECLLSAGPGAFYNKLSTEQVEPFLSPDEVSQVSSWAEDRRREESVDNEDTESENDSDTEGLSLQYFPMQSDTPAPCLDLGWPEKDRWEGVERVRVYTNPPVGQAPHIREVIRRLLQGAMRLIAIVADKVTDSMVIGDLNFAASRGVVVYIILNQRSTQGNLPSQRLQHPNIRVRTVEGKSFFSRHGKMVVGELKENFILVDLLTVVLGSYSLTWTDAHLHRQLITVMNGPVVELFDQEFRILYAASVPIPDSLNNNRTVTFPKVDRNHNLYQPELSVHKPSLRESVPSPPPPITDSPIDWNALGVFQKTEGFQEDGGLPDFCDISPNSYGAGFRKHTEVTEAGKEPSVKEVHTTQWQDESKAYQIAAESRHAPDHQTMFGNFQKHDRVQYGFLTEREDSLPTLRNIRMEINPKEDVVPYSHAYRQDCHPGTDRGLGENMKPDLKMPTKKPLILSLPQTGSSRDLTDIFKKLNLGKSKMGLQHKVFRQTMSRSTLDLSTQLTDTPTQSQTNLYDSFPMTPALALMKKRNDEVKYSFMRNVPPQPRSRSFSFTIHKEKWKQPFSPQKSGKEE